MREPYPSETKDRFMVRLPDGMREKIKAAADAANRTMNGEIVGRLEASFENAQQPLKWARTSKNHAAEIIPDPNVEDRISALEKTALALIANISDLQEELARKTLSRRSRAGRNDRE
jgi:hypothetical protein